MPLSSSATVMSAIVGGLTDDGCGVVRVDNKVVFVAGALPGEEIVFRLKKRRRHYDQGILVEILKPSAQRVRPPCEYFGVCGGCGLQHMAPAAQVEAKEQILREQFNKFGRCKPENWLPPLTGDSLHYRRKARLGVKHVFKKGTVLVGFRERGSSFIADIHSCQTLDQRFSSLLPELRTLVMSLSCHQQLPQIEVAAGDDQIALVFRHLVALTAEDRQRLSDFGQRHQAQIHTQSKGPDTVTALWPSQPQALSYHLPEFDLEMRFRTTDFIQVNADMNRRMVSLAVELMQLQPGDRVLDLFCGLGNFTLPLARKAARVIGVEAGPGLLEQARGNAIHNGLDNVEFRQADLYADDTTDWRYIEFNKLLLDPPRDGAFQVVKTLPKNKPELIVYVSCNPVTLARDTDHLVNKEGYRLLQAGVMDMFPHTNHVESIALFAR